MERIKKYLNIIIASAVSFSIGYFILKPKPEVKEVIKYVTVEVEKKQTKKTTKVRETKNPDGSSTTDTVITEDTSSETSTVQAGSKETTISQSKGISIGVLALKDLDRFSEKTHAGAVISVPLLGNLSATSYLDTTKRVGIGLSLEF